MYIASIAGDVKIHTWPSGQLVNAYKGGGQDGIRTVSWGKDGNWLVIVPTQGPAEIITIRENVLKHLYTIEDVQQPVCAAFQNLTKRNIALGTNTGNILIYDIKSKSVRKHFPRASATVFRVEYGMKDNYLIAACENGEILSFNSATMNCTGSYKVPNSKSVSTIRTHVYRRNLFMGGSKEGIVAVWDINRNSVVHKNTPHQAIITDVSFSPIRHDLIVSCGLDRKFVFWDTTSNSVVLQKIMDCSPTSIDFCQDGVGLAVGTQTGSICTYDTRRMNSPMYVFKAHQSFVKQLLFQKTFSEESGDYGLREAGDCAPPRVSDIPAINVDSFASMLQDITSGGQPEQQNQEHDFASDLQQDSFLDAMGITANSLRDSHYGPISKGVRKLLDSNPNLLENSDQSTNLSREAESGGCNPGRELGVATDNLRDTPRIGIQYRQHSQSPASETPRQYQQGDYEERQEGGGESIRNVVLTRGSRRQSYDQPQFHNRRSDCQQQSRSVGKPPLVENRMQQGDQQSQQRLSHPSVRNRQLERIVASSEIRSVSEDEQPVNVPIELVKSQHNSTPKTQAQSANKAPTPLNMSPIEVSPIIQPLRPAPNVAMDMEEFHNTVREVVKQEVKDQLETFHQSLKYDIMEALAQIRRNFLDIQMSIVKEFVQLESSLNRVREDLVNEEGLTDELLIQENIRLHKELALLREQVIRKDP